MHHRIALIATAVALFAAGAAVAQDPIKARRAGFDDNKKAMAEVKAALDKGDAAAAAAPAQRMAAFAAQIPALFPAGSDKGDTKAKAAIWTAMADFEAKAKAFGDAAVQLRTVAATGDKAAVMKQFAAVGGTCKACHDSYRAD